MIYITFKYYIVNLIFSLFL